MAYQDGISRVQQCARSVCWWRCMFSARELCWWFDTSSCRLNFNTSLITVICTKFKTHLRTRLENGINCFKLSAYLKSMSTLPQHQSKADLAPIFNGNREWCGCSWEVQRLLLYGRDEDGCMGGKNSGFGNLRSIKILFLWSIKDWCHVTWDRR